MSNSFRSADEMVHAVVNSQGEIRVAACSVAVEQKTKLVVEIAIGAIAFVKGGVKTYQRGGAKLYH